MAVSLLGINIKRIREEKGMSAYKLANEAGVGAATISQIETGKRQALSSGTIEKIASVLGVSANELFYAEPGVDYVVQDIKEVMNFILESEELTFEDIEMTLEEKNLLMANIELTLDAIHRNRKSKADMEKKIMNNLKK